MESRFSLQNTAAWARVGQQRDLLLARAHTLSSPASSAPPPPSQAREVATVEMSLGEGCQMNVGKE